MSSKSQQPVPMAMSLRQVRARLGPLTADEARRAVAAGLLKTRGGPDHYDAGSVLAAAADLEAWRARLAEEQWLNATEAAARLGVTTERFRRAVAANGVEPVEREYWRYGRWISYYRAADVDALAPWLVMDAAARHVAAAAKRPEAARKAAETRRRNTEAKRAAREELAALVPSAGAPGPELVRFVAALLLAYSEGLGKLGRFRHDHEVEKLAGVMAKARLSDEERSKWLSEWHGPALDAARWLVKAADLERGYGLHPGSLCARLPCVSGFVSQADFDVLLRDDPGYLEDCRRKEQERRMLEEARKLAEAEERRARQERLAMLAKAELLASDPGPDPHPADAAEWALTGLLALGFGSHPLVSRARSLAGQDFMQRSWAKVDRLPTRRFEDDEMAARLLGLLESALGCLSSLRPTFRRKRYDKRLAEMRRRGLKTAGDLAVLSEVQAIVDADPGLAERWRNEDAADASAAQLKAKEKAQRRAAKQERRRQRTQGWRRHWAQVFGVPVDQVPAEVSRPTPAAVEALRKHPPAWARLAKDN